MSVDNITTISLPDDFYFVKNSSFQLKSEREIFVSGFTAEMPRFGGANFMRWTCDIELCGLGREEWQAYESFVADQQGQPYAFTLYDSARCLPLGAGAGFDPKGPAQHWVDPNTSTQHWDEGHWVDGATFCKLKTNARRYASSIVVTGVPSNSIVLKKGDLFSLGGNLYASSGVIKSDSNGDARINFNWRLWKSALKGDLIDFKKPSGRFILTPGSDDGVSRDHISKFGYANMRAIEVPYA